MGDLALRGDLSQFLLNFIGCFVEGVVARGRVRTLVDNVVYKVHYLVHLATLYLDLVLALDQCPVHALENPLLHNLLIRLQRLYQVLQMVLCKVNLPRLRLNPVIMTRIETQHADQVLTCPFLDIDLACLISLRRQQLHTGVKTTVNFVYQLVAAG